MASMDAEREARKKKLRELEASLFGATNSLNGGVMTGLPELKNVNEYSGLFGQAERRKKSALPGLRRPEVKPTFFAKPKTGGYARLQESEDEEEEYLSSSGSSSALGGPPPLKAIPHRRRSSGTSSAHLLKSEVEELDQSLQFLETNPKQQVLDNIKKKHGIKRSPSLETSYTNQPFVYPANNDLTNVAGLGESLGRASIMDNLPQRRRTISSPVQMGSRKTSAEILAPHSSGSNLTQSPAPSLGYAQAISPGSAEDGRLTADWPSMPEIKASMPIKGGRRDSLQPLPLKPKAKGGMKKLSLSRAADQLISPLASTTPGLEWDVNPFAEPLARASRLPAIGDGKHVPQIKIDTSPRPRRDPQKKTLNEDAQINGSSQYSGLVNFDGLERTYSTTPPETFRDVPSTVHDVPSALTNMSTNTFDSIPTDIFDSLPRAVTAREHQRQRRFQEQHQLSSTPLTSSVPSSAGSLMTHHEIKSPLSTMSSPGRMSEQGRVDILSALFPNATEKEQTPANAPNLQRRRSYPRPTSSSDPRLDPEVGHFCAPWVPGFCEANYCIFHCSTRPTPTAESQDEA